jgi:hypothetical protein
MANSPKNSGGGCGGRRYFEFRRSCFIAWQAIWPTSFCSGAQRVIPNKALSSGFVFRHETLRSAFEAIL